MSIKTPEQVRVAFEFTSATDKKLNGPVYPKGSNHDCDCFSPGCQWCVGRVWCMWFLGAIDPNTGEEREFPYITEEEQARNRERADRFENSYQPEARVNNF